ncbi:TadE family type IV pilus minor pilin [Kitasatospora sp. NPDC089509]|uniref:TadE family type IV pilus minor pilin n=1 Tax=Kitasatospora sp. NPDC089509 TaxID=3364079 RepID=UPI00380A7006
MRRSARPSSGFRIRAAGVRPAASLCGSTGGAAPDSREVEGSSEAEHGREVRRPARRGDAGFVTAETAVVLPALVLLAAMLIWAVLAAAAQIACVDAARIGARAAARGEPDAVELARAAAPPGARVRMAVAADTVRIDVDAPCAAPGRLGGLLAVRVGATAVAAREDVLGGITEGGGSSWPT